MIDQIQKIVFDANEGNINEIEAYVTLKRIETALSEAIKAVHDAAFDKAEMEGKKTFTAFGAEVTIKEGATRYKFDHIPEWNDAKTKLSEIETNAKNLAKLRMKKIMGVTDDGEVLNAAELIPGRATLSIRLLKE